MALTDYQSRALRHPVRWLRNREPEQPDGEDIPRRELSSLAVSLIGQNQVFSMATGDQFMHFCINVLRISHVRVGAIIGLTSAFDAINDPIAGAIVDRHRFKDGSKLLPWMKFTAPLIALFSFLLFINWGMTPSIAAIYVAVVYILWDITYSFHDSALWGMTAAIHPSSRQSARTVQWADIGASLGGLLPGAIMMLLGGGGEFGLTQQQIYFMFALVLCIGGGLLTLFALQMKERVHSLPEPERKRSDVIKVLARNVYRVRHNHVLLLFFLVRILESATPNISQFFMFQDMAAYNVLGLFEVRPTVLFPIFTVVFGAPGLLLKPFALKIADRVGSMKRILIIGRVTAILAQVIGFFIGIRTWQAMVLVSLLDGISHLPNSLFNIAQRSMLSDSVDYVEWKTGHRTEGITMSIRNFMSKLGGAIRRFIATVTLAWLQHNPEYTDARLPQNAHFQRWSWPAFRMGPAIGLVLSLIPLLLVNYPDSLRDQVEADLVARRNITETQLEEETANT
ncbi:MAG: MFS transporter [Oscillospiraceae bacterium]|nr:MFS transporter [Oscillospiraceae bacterium]